MQPGVLSALALPTGGAEPDPYLLPEPMPQRRLALADWVANPQNPLTTRSIANRVWQHHFGKPSAGNPNNVDAKGGKPTQPELPDWLAADFTEHGWTPWLQNPYSIEPTLLAWEFYDLRSDPHENRNEYANPQYTGVIRDLKQEMKQLRADLQETDEGRPHIQKVIDAHWND